MKKILMGLLILALLFSCSKDDNKIPLDNGSKYSNLTDDDYSVYGAVLYPLSAINLVINTTDTNLNCSDLLLMNADTLGITHEIINSCIETNKSIFSFEDGKLLSGGLKLVNTEELTLSKSPINILEKYGANGMYTFGRPVFYNNKQNAIYQLSYYCGGLCGNGAIVIAEKSNDTWGVKYYLVTWISK